MKKECIRITKTTAMRDPKSKTDGAATRPCHMALCRRPCAAEKIPRTALITHNESLRAPRDLQVLRRSKHIDVSMVIVKD